MSEKRLIAEQFYTVEELNDELDYTPADDIYSIIVKDNSFILIKKREEYEDEVDGESDITDLKAYIDFYGLDNLIDILKILRSHRICTSACLARMLSEL